MKRFIKFLSFRPEIMVAAMAVIFFFIYAWPYFSLNSQAHQAGMMIMNTPDETANYFFAKLFAESSRLDQLEPLNLMSAWQLIHPRGTTVVAGHILPGGFLGFIILAGLFGKFFSVLAIPLLTPLASAVAIYAFYLLLVKIFRRRVAFFSTLGLAVMPAFWYYSSRSLFNNIFFIDLLIIASAFLIYFIEQKKLWQIISFSFFLALALFVRPAEALWVFLLVLLIFFFYRSRISWKKIIWPIGFTILAGLITFLIQKNLYGDYLATGYAPEAAGSSDGNQILVILKQLFLPFGFDLGNLAYNFWHYFVKMFWWQFILATLGGVIIVWQYSRQKLSMKIGAYLTVATIVSLAVFSYYGSWFFFNNLTASALIGSSQVRYFLPIYILTIPLMIYALDSMLGWIKWGRAKSATIIIILSVILILSFETAMLKGPESLLAVRKTLINYYQINQEAVNLTEPDSVIISSYSDKLFFPKRRVGFYWQDPRFLADWSHLARAAKIYFYDIDNGKEIDDIQANSSLKAKLVKKINDRESLYQLSN